MSSKPSSTKQRKIEAEASRFYKSMIETGQKAMLEQMLAEWLEEQRAAKRAGTLADWQIEKLESLPNFTW